MNYEDYIEQGLNGEAPLKLILRGSIQNSGNEKVGVVSVAYATLDKRLAESKIRELAAEIPAITIWCTASRWMWTLQPCPIIRP